MIGAASPTTPPPSPHPDALLSLYQIGVLITGLYLSLTFIALSLFVPFGTTFELASHLSDRALNTHSMSGSLTIAAHSLTAVPMTALLSVTLRHSTLCFDFALTTYAIHFLLCTILFRVPRSPEWWILNPLAVLCVTLASEAITSRWERREIMIMTQEMESR